MLKRFVFLAGVASAMLIGPSSGAAASCVTASGTTTCTFVYTGAVEPWVVPAGVTSAVFEVQGGSGGDMLPGAGFVGGNGGLGGSVSATVAVTAGETLNLRVAGRGQNGIVSPNPFDGTLTALGGFNGGGTTSITCSGCAFILGGGGGGASDVRSSGDSLADRFLVAGGGGGGGIGGDTDPGTGGNSATTAPSAFSTFSFPAVTCTGGGAGSLTAGGAGGGGTGCQTGSAGSIGSGGSAVTWRGAGGGGLYGGGAGASGTFGPEPATGGGGGSNYPDPANLPAGTTNVTVNNGVRSGNGLITVSYQIASQVVPSQVVPPRVNRAGYCSVAGNKTPAGTPIAPGTFLNLAVGQNLADANYAGAVPANYLQGLGISCDRPPGYVATSETVGYSGKGDPGSYPYYARSG